MSDFIDDMILESFNLKEASKNITELGEYKAVNICLKFRDGYNTGVNINVAFSVDGWGKISHTQSIKVLGKYLDGEVMVSQGSMKSFSPSEVTEELLATICKIEELFEESDLANKRLYM